MRKGSANKNELKDGNDAVTQNSKEVTGIVTRAILSEELEARDYVTKDYLREEFLSFEARLDAKLDTKMDAKFLGQRKEYERYAGAWAENLQSQMSAIAEMVVSMAEDMTSIKEWIREDHQRIHSQIDFRLNALETSASKA